MIGSHTHRVYSEGAAGRWQGIPGYVVRGASVYCESKAQACRVARNIAIARAEAEGLDRDTVPAPITTEDGIYYYATQEDADRDDTGMLAAAVVYAVADDEEVRS